MGISSTDEARTRSAARRTLSGNRSRSPTSCSGTSSSGRREPSSSAPTAAELVATAHAFRERRASSATRATTTSAPVARRRRLGHDLHGLVEAARPAPAPTLPRQAHRGRPRRPRPPAVLDAQPSRPRQSMVEGRSSSEGEPVASANPDPVALGRRQDGRAGKARTASTRRRRVGASGPAIDSPDGPASQTTRCGTSRGVTCRPRGGRSCLSLPPRSAKRAGSAQAREGPRTAALLLHVRGPGRAGPVPAPDHLAPGPERLRALDLVTTGPRLSGTGSRWIAPRSGRRTWGRWGAHERS